HGNAGRPADYAAIIQSRKSANLSPIQILVMDLPPAGRLVETFGHLRRGNALNRKWLWKIRYAPQPVHHDCLCSAQAIADCLIRSSKRLVGLVQRPHGTDAKSPACLPADQR